MTKPWFDLLSAEDVMSRINKIKDVKSVYLTMYKIVLSMEAHIFNIRWSIRKCLTLFIKNNFFPKELSLCHKLWLSNPNIFAIQFRRPYIFQPMTSVRSNSLSLKYQRFRPSVYPILRSENLSLWQRLNSFIFRIS